MKGVSVEIIKVSIAAVMAILGGCFVYSCMNGFSSTVQKFLFLVVCGISALLYLLMLHVFKIKELKGGKNE